MYRFLIAILSIMFFSCSEKQPTKDYEIEINIEIGNSYKYDLKNNVYTIFRLWSPDTLISFNLSIAEKKRIIDKYYTLKLDSLDEGTTIGVYDHDPAIYHLIKAKSRGKTQTIKIEAGRNDYNFSDTVNAKKINEFIKFTKSILNSKPEIKNAPESDIGYF